MDYPFSVIRERDRLEYIYEGQRTEGMKRRQQQYRSNSKGTPKKSTVEDILPRGMQTNITEEKMNDIRDKLKDDINELIGEIRSMNDEIHLLQKGILSEKEKLLKVVQME